ncbi:hypothetical protein K1719_044320 [Acacia pycnantha]|nr:hypothetical protein K1719_044320 [Acacia pycnantha]
MLGSVAKLWEFDDIKEVLENNKCRGRTKYYVISDEDYDDDRPLDETKCAPLERFLCNYSGRGIPSWFSKNTLGCFSEVCVIKVNIPRDFRDVEWLGIVVCLPVIWGDKCTICWSTKAPKMGANYEGMWVEINTKTRDTTSERGAISMISTKSPNHSLLLLIRSAFPEST